MKYQRRALFTLAMLAGIMALISSDAANIQYAFTQGATYPTGSLPEYIAVADLNHDGVPDIVTADAGSNSISVLLGNKDGTYQPRKVYKVGNTNANPDSVTLADLDGDGNLDAIVTGHDDNTVTILWGKGDGTFSSSTVIGTFFSGPHRVAVGDLDGDGHMDFAVVDSGADNIELYFGKGNRQFTHANLGTPGSPTSITFGDLNGDGKPDIVVGGAEVSVFLNLGNRQFSSTNYSLFNGDRADQVIVEDVNHDGKGNVITASQQQAAVNILLNNGDGTLDQNQNDIVTYPLSGGATGLFLQDVNGDGIPDLIVSYTAGSAISVLIGTTQGHFLARTDSVVTALTDHIAVTHLSASDNVDLIGSSSTTNSVTLFYGNPGIALGSPATFPVGNSPSGIAVGDLNNDGNPDLVTTNTVDNTVSVLLGSTNGNYGSRTDFSVGISPRRVRLGDFNDDGHLDAATVNSGSGSVTVLLGTGTGIFGAQSTIPAGTSPTDLVIANLNGAKDGAGHLIQDIAVADPGSGQVLTLINSGACTSTTGACAFTAGAALAVSGTPFAIAAGDLEGNGNEDLVVTEATGNKLAVLHNDGAGNFTLLAEYPVGKNPQSVTIADFGNTTDANGNPILDIAVANFGDGTVSILTNNLSPTGAVTGTFTLKSTVTIIGKGNTVPNAPNSVQPIDILAADMNGDKLPDLVTTNNEGSLSVLLNAGGTSFNSQSTLVDGSGPAQTVAADMNGDGRLDLATADKTTSVVAVRLTSATNVPQANDVSIGLDTHQASFVTGTLSATSPTGGSVTYQIVSSPADGTVTLVDPVAGTFKYTPASNFTGTDTFTYEALNGTIPSNQATVSILVTNSGSGSYSWLLVALLGGFAAWRTFMQRRGVRATARS